MYRRDWLIAVVLVAVLIATLATVYVATNPLGSRGVRTALAVAGTLLVLFNAASIRAMLRHNREDQTYIYTLDIKHLDEYRAARAARGARRNDAP
jgi:hypothetical protein